MADEPAFPIKPVKQRLLLYEVVQEEIKNHIIQNELKPGDRLPPETELAQKLGVSRNSVREAVKALEMLDIVETRSGAGLFVGNFSFDALLENVGYGIMFNLTELADILEVRFYVEYGMIPRAAAAVTPAQLAALHQIVNDMRKAAQKGEYLAEHDRLFHKTMWMHVENSVAAKILDVFWHAFYLARRQSAIPEPEDLMRTVKRHATILEALENRDIEALQDSLIDHYAGIQARLQHIQKLHSSKTNKD
jgi:DNA-binding FadR family transcriptional regulator